MRTADGARSRHYRQVSAEEAPPIVGVSSFGDCRDAPSQGTRERRAMGEPAQTSRGDVGRGLVQNRAPATASRGHGTAQTGLRHLRFDVGNRPFLVLVELTRACELACRHCRAEAKRERDPDELTTTEIAAILDDLGSLGAPRPIVVFTGGDPLMRPDLVELVRHGVDAQLAVAVAPAGTPHAAPAVLGELRRAGVSTVSFSLDGASASTHDAFRLTQGSFNWTVAACTAARRAGLRLQLNTTVTEETAHELPEVLDLARRLGVSLWSVFFLVPMGRGKALRPLSAEGIEDVLEFLFEAAAVIPLEDDRGSPVPPDRPPSRLRRADGNGGAGSPLRRAPRPSRRPRNPPSGPDGSGDHRRLRRGPPAPTARRRGRAGRRLRLEPRRRPTERIPPARRGQRAGPASR